jgi:hypothetical protein
MPLPHVVRAVLLLGGVRSRSQRLLRRGEIARVLVVPSDRVATCSRRSWSRLGSPQFTYFVALRAGTGQAENGIELMNIEHEPLRQVAYLQQCLSHDKRPIGFLLAAGCPLAIRDDKNEPLIPDITGLTKVIAKEMSSGKHSAAYGKVIANLKADGLGEPHLEQILTHIRSLLQVAGIGEVRTLKATELDELDQAVCAAIVTAVDKKLPDAQTPFHRMAAWIKAANRETPVEIFTTNYDLLIEQALEEHRVPYFDGFVGSRHPFFDTHAIEADRLPPRWARLWKLHGSINWRQNAQGVAYRDREAGTSLRYMIHPSHLKYDESRRMPYLAMIDRLRAFLKQPSAVLLTCGYSFGDQHLNACLTEALAGNARGMLFALLRREIIRYSPAIKLAERHGNFSLLARDKAIIGTRLGTWMERDSTGGDDDSVAVTWKDSTTKGRKTPSFMLGDFARLGESLAELIGVESQPPANDGK